MNGCRGRVVLVCLAALALSCSTDLDSTEPAFDAHVVFIGIDGASWEQALPLMRRGELPNLQALAQEGYSGRLSTMAPALSPVVWTTIATGKVPEKHGIRDFIVHNRKTKKHYLVTSNMRRTSAIWNILSDSGLNVGVVGWWVTWPAEPVNGWMVSPYTAPGQTTWKGSVYVDGQEHQTWPEDYLAEIAPDIEQGVEEATRRFGALFSKPPGMKLADYLQGFLADTEWVHVSDTIFRNVGVKLLQKERPRFFATYLGGVDVIGHRFWRFAHPEDGGWPTTGEEQNAFGAMLDNYYRWVDDAIGRLLAAAPPGATVVVVSDHGMEWNPPPDGPRRPTPWNLFPEEISGGHSRGPDGLFIVSGAHAARNFDPGLWADQTMPRLGSDAHPGVLDVLPSLLHLFGLPVGEDMDGEVRRELFDSEISGRAVRFVATWDDPSRLSDPAPVPVEGPLREEIERRLKGLGYIGD